MSTTAIGRQAEDRATNYLAKMGHEILARNWRTKRCEVDIITKKGGCIYFVEVKYRRSESTGSGFKYITAAKYKQLRFAATAWVALNSWEGTYDILAIEVSNYALELTSLTASELE